MMLQTRGWRCQSAPYRISLMSVATFTSARLVTVKRVALSLPVTAVCAAMRGAQLLGHVRGLHAVALYLDVRRELAQGHSRAQVGQPAGTVVVAGQHEGRSGRAGQHGRRVQRHPQVQLRPAAGHGEARRRRGPGLLDEPLVQAHALAVDACAVSGQQATALGVQHGAADVVEQAERGLMDLTAAAFVQRALACVLHFVSSCRRRARRRRSCTCSACPQATPSTCLAVGRRPRWRPRRSRRRRSRRPRRGSWARRRS